MTIPFQEDEEEDDLLLDSAVDISDDDLLEEGTPEVTLEDVESLEEEDNTGHKVQTFDPADDGVDNYFDERYFDE